MKLKPLADKIVVKPDVRELSSIIFVDNKEVENMGTVIAVGPGKKLSGGPRDGGRFHPLDPTPDGVLKAWEQVRRRTGLAQ